MSKRCVGMLGWMLMPMASLAAQVGNPSGTGPLPAVAQSLETLPGHTLFAPVKLPKDPLPLLVWGNGACRDNGLAHGAFLRPVASQGYIGVALGKPGRRVICLDGDGSVLMHMGALPVIGSLAPRNLIHVVLNNSAHESVGGQPTVAGELDFRSLVKACGYRAFSIASDEAGIRSAWREFSAAAGPVLLEVRVGLGSRDDLGRPKSSPEDNKHAFIEAARD